VLFLEDDQDFEWLRGWVELNLVEKYSRDLNEGMRGSVNSGWIVGLIWEYERY
jgi:hypothetical protein